MFTFSVNIQQEYPARVTITPGSRLAHDEIVSPLGKGGVRPKVRESIFSHPETGAER